MSSSDFLNRMENYYGELADIVRPSGSGAGGNTTEWQYPSYYPSNYSIPDPPQDFGNPFTHLRDPLLHDIDIPESGFGFMNASTESARNSGGFSRTNNDGSIKLGHKSLDHDMDELKRDSSNIFSKMLHISPNPKLRESPCHDSPAVIGPTGSKGPSVLVRPNSGLVESPVLQISSTPQNMGVKKRKNQTKKVICIPAPAPANSRPTGEIVPSDLWAWRKYGQKPIKGSPYPRGYYRCSSSKGCMARKQVERSRTDSNMLVITYTSEHNHPWPTQRNALAGSTRSHHQSTTSSKNTTANSKSSPNSQSHKAKNPTTNEDKGLSTENASPVNVKEEVKDQDHNPFDIDGNEEFDEDRFFADLGEINEAHDPLDFLLNRSHENTGLDPFSLY